MIKVVASHNALQATALAYEMLVEGSDALDACVAAVTSVEDNLDDLTVGRGGLPNEDGQVELDAAVMHGPTHQAGAVACLRGICHAAQVAQLVMQQTDHTMLAGEGALRFALANGFPQENLLSDKARRLWLHWKRIRSSMDDWLDPGDDEIDEDIKKFFSRYTGTVHVAAMDNRGDISCVTSTSGLAFKLPGRIADSCVIGSGLYVDNRIGSCGSTGRGEASMGDVVSFAAVELMRSGMPPQQAGLAVLRRVVGHAPARLLDENDRPRFDLRLFLLGSDGTHAGLSIWGPKKYAVTDEQGTRLVEGKFLYEREK